MKKLDFTVVGAPRSGTSLLSSLIDRHPKIRIAHDTGLYYYLKFALIEIIYLMQAKKDLTFSQGYNSLPLNNLADQQIVDQFLKKKPRILLSLQPSDQFRRILDQYLFRLWSFWTRDFNAPDPTKDRNKAGIFLECIDIRKLFDTSSVKELILEYQSLLIASINQEQPEQYDDTILIGEKTPDNNSCGDIINKFNPNTKVVEIIRNPCTLYAARKRRGLTSKIESFVAWHQLFATTRYFDESQVMTVRYEDLVSETEKMLNQIYQFLDLPPYKEENSQASTSTASQMLYSKYVGTKVDKQRDQTLHDLLSESEINEIKEKIPYNY